MTDIQAMVAEFHGAFNLPNRLGQGKPDAFHERTELRSDLIEEEFGEFLDSHKWAYSDYHELVDVDTIEYADALADLVYVAYGAALEAGINLNEVLEAVHASNMAKLDADGKPIYREDGKVAKPEGWQPPNIKEVLGLD